MQQANKRDRLFHLGKKKEEMPFLIPDFLPAIRAPSLLPVRPSASGIIHRRWSVTTDDTVAPNGDDRGLSRSLYLSLSFATHD